MAADGDVKVDQGEGRGGENPPETDAALLMVASMRDRALLKAPEPGACGCGRMFCDSTLEEERAMVARAKQATSINYRMATSIGFHPFIEFNGLMLKFLELCERELRAGRHVTLTDIHSSGDGFQSAEGFDGDYLGEKFACIFGRTLESRQDFREAFLLAITNGKKDHRKNPPTKG